MATYISFADEFIDPILHGEKQETLRYNLTDPPIEGEILPAMSQSGPKITDVQIDVVEQLSVTEAANRTYQWHRNYNSEEELLDHLQTFYYETLTVDSTIWYIKFHQAES